MPKRKVATKIGNGTGYAGDARGDATKRKKLQKKAHDKEIETMKEQQATLANSSQALSSNRPEEPSLQLLNLIKSILRNQANWSCTSYSSQRNTVTVSLYQSALDCCEGILEKFPKLLGKQDDDESLLMALLEMVSTADIVSKHATDYASDVQAIATRVLQLKPRAIQASKLALEQDDLLVVDNHAHYRQMLRPLAFDFVNDLPGHTYVKETNSSSSIQRKQILKELSTYQTALPIEYGSSVFIRAMEGRMDLLRCLIIGPDDSPYACGLFFFDIYLDRYPTGPPKVKFLTTGSGKYRMNPNLYNDGKVCLSLLGTWAGPGWQPGESTLLQVLVSIQSLILVQDPYFNEPGFQREEGTDHGRRKSKQYNANIRRYTIDAAILPHLRRMGGNMSGYSSPLYPEFQDIVEKHFTLKQRAWKKQLNEWRKEASQEACHSQGKTMPFIGVVMDSLYISCLDIWEGRSKKQNSKRNGESSSTSSSSTSRRPLHTNEPLNAFEVNGVIEIDLESGDEGGGSSTQPSATARKCAVQVPNAGSACTPGSDDVIIDLT